MSNLAEVFLCSSDNDDDGGGNNDVTVFSCSFGRIVYVHFCFFTALLIKINCLNVLF